MEFLSLCFRKVIYIRLDNVFFSNSVDVEFRSSRARTLWDKWRYVWMLAWERQRRLHDHLVYLKDVERVRQFSWDDWRKRVSLHNLILAFCVK